MEHPQGTGLCVYYLSCAVQQGFCCISGCFCLHSLFSESGTGSCRELYPSCIYEKDFQYMIELFYVGAPNSMALFFLPLHVVEKCLATFPSVELGSESVQ